MQNATPKHRQIKRTMFTICAILLMFPGIAQIQAQFGSRRGGFGGGADRLERAGLKIGLGYPNITVYDADGVPFKLDQLKGQYTVIVLGCLT